MESYGLEVEVEQFPLTYFEDFGSLLEVIGGPTLNSVTMYYAPAGDVTAEMVFCGLGQPADFASVNAVGKIALMRRGVIPYSAKIANAAAAGAVAAVVFNSAPEIMYATLGSMGAIPAVSLSGEEGAVLLGLLASGPVTAHLVVNSVYYPSFSQNIIGTRTGTQPEQGTVYLGAHYDSVWFGPGANDNASGLGCLLEAARVLSTKGHSTKATIKFVAFGAEEPGLIGSQYHVFANEEQITAQCLGMVNMDMLGVGDTLLIGNLGLSDSSLSAYAQEKAAAMKIESWAAVPAAANSDHVYFEVVGVPAVRLEQSPDPWYHSAGDSMDKINPVVMEANGELAAAVVYDWAKNPALRAKKAEKAASGPAAVKARKFHAD
jgi:aminopeptidase YwaD